MPGSSPGEGWPGFARAVGSVASRQAAKPPMTSLTCVNPRSAVGVEPPFEHGTWNVDGTGHDAVALTIELAADIDDEGASVNGRERRVWLVAPDPRTSLVDQLVEGPPPLADSHRAHDPSSAGQCPWLRSSRVRYDRPPM